MKIKLSKSQWELIGNKTGWMKKAQMDELPDGYGNETQRAVAEEKDLIRSHANEYRDPKKCPCRGSGWFNSNYDTWEKCPLHWTMDSVHPEGVM